MTYNLIESRKLVLALRAEFGDSRFDEYSINAKSSGLPLGFLHDRKRTRRASIAHWLRWAADQGFGLERDPDNPTWFRISSAPTASVERG